MFGLSRNEKRVKQAIDVSNALFGYPFNMKSMMQDIVKRDSNATPAGIAVLSYALILNDNINNDFTIKELEAGKNIVIGIEKQTKLLQKDGDIDNTSFLLTLQVTSNLLNIMNTKINFLSKGLKF